MVAAHQKRAGRAGRVPWWGYLVMFVLAASTGTANDFADLTGTKTLSAVIMVLLVVVFVTSVLTRSVPLSRLRGVRGRQTFVPPVFSVIAVFGYTTATTRRLRHCWGRLPGC